MAIATPNVRAVKETTSTISIVMVHVGGPARFRLVISSTRPSSKLAGRTITTDPKLAGKHLELLTEVIPTLSCVAVLSSPGLVGALTCMGWRGQRGASA